MPFFGTIGGSQPIRPGIASPGVGPQDTTASSAAGSLGTTTVNSNTTSTSVSGQRVAVNPLGGGGITYSISSGSLPPGFSLNSGNGTVSGSYTVQGINTPGTVYTFTVRATSQLNPASTSDRTYTVSLAVPFRFRQIISTCYFVGGYKNSVLWNNGNRTTVSTETSVNLGNDRINNFHYNSGATGIDRLYVWIGNSTSAFNMRTEVRQNQGQAIGSSAGNTGTVHDERNNAYVNGEGPGAWRRWAFATETFTATIGGGWNSHGAGFSGETRGIMWDNGGYTARILWSNESVAGMGHSAGAHGQQKGQMGKNGFGYGGAQGSYSGGFQMRKTNIETESGAGTIGKPWGDCGEENFTMSQDVAFMLGQHDPSGQNNRSWRWVYATDAASQGGSALEPKGQAGCSSGHCGWRD